MYIVYYGKIWLSEPEYTRMSRGEVTGSPCTAVITQAVARQCSEAKQYPGSRERKVRLYSVHCVADFNHFFCTFVLLSRLDYENEVEKVHPPGTHIKISYYIYFLVLSCVFLCVSVVLYMGI